MKFRVVLTRVATIETDSEGSALRLGKLFLDYEPEDEEDKRDELPMGLNSGRVVGTAIEYESDLLATPAGPKEPSHG